MTVTSKIIETKIPDKSGEQETPASTDQVPVTLDNGESASDDVVTTTQNETLAPSSGGESKQLMSRMVLNDNKAGMQGLDKERINQIIFETSKGSIYGLIISKES